MERRGFLGCGALAGVGALAGLSDAEAPSTPVDIPAFELDEVSVADLQQQMARGERSAEQITRPTWTASRRSTGAARRCAA